jgi:tRNA pseudouridine synthase 10
MAKTLLCTMCASRFGKLRTRISISKDAANCHICHGMLLQIPKMVASAVISAKGTEWKTFSVSSTFPRAVLVREAGVAEWSSPGEFTSLKNSVNSVLIAALSRETKKENTQRNSEITFEFDFAKSSANAKSNQTYIFGHYLKFSRNHCQSRWHCSECGGKGCDACGGSGRNYPSVEDELGKSFCAGFSASGVKLHASGREDVDVRCMGTGRPFVLELENPKRRNVDLAAIEHTLSENKNVRAIGLKLVKKSMIDSVCNSHFEKKYVAIVSADRPLTSQDAKKAENLSGIMLEQQTPKRVLSRRADLVRNRKVISVRADATDDGKLVLEILADAGTYIKELISSDGGRTKPSVSELLNCFAVCEQLDVVEIHDFFLETLSPEIFI